MSSFKRGRFLFHSLQGFANVAVGARKLARCVGTVSSGRERRFHLPNLIGRAFWPSAELNWHV
jgi:hypothetical protein